MTNFQEICQGGLFLMTQIPEHENVERVEEIRVQRDAVGQREERVVHAIGDERRQNLHRASQVVWLLGSILQAAIGMRILLKLMAANPDAGFARFVYALTEPFLAPFFGLLPTPGANGAVLEISSLVAMLVYGFLTWLVVRLIWLIFDRPAARTISTHEQR
jgi:YggT family protein